MTTRALILSDTHLHAHDLELPHAVASAAERADLIIHAGDIIAPELLDKLGEFAPVHVVAGNNDLDLIGVLPDRLSLTVAGVAIGLVHDSGAAIGRAGRLQRWFPDAAVVIFGHSHQPTDEAGAAGQRLFNPGSPTQRRRAPTHTYGWLEADAATIVSLTLVDIGR